MEVEIIIHVDDQERLPIAKWRLLVKARAGFRCEECSETERRLDAHHVNEDDQDNRLANGRCLCRRCHHLQHPEYERTDKHRAAISAANTGHHTSTSTRASISAKARERWADPEFKEMMAKTPRAPWTAARRAKFNATIEKRGT